MPPFRANTYLLMNGNSNMAHKKTIQSSVLMLSMMQKAPPVVAGFTNSLAIHLEATTAISTSSSSGVFLSCIDTASDGPFSLTLANEMLSLVGSLLDDPFHPSLSTPTQTQTEDLDDIIQDVSRLSPSDASDQYAEERVTKSTSKRKKGRRDGGESQTKPVSVT
jgi:hypothetical protein